MSVQAVVPVHKYSQAQLTTAFADLIASSGPYDHQLLERFHANTGVKSRHLALPLERYAQLADFDQSNDAFIEVAVELGADALTRAVQAAGLRPEDVDLVLSTTITGLAVPSIEARIAGRVGLRDDVKRLPVVGLGCAAGAAGIGRMHDYLLGHPREVAVLLAVELCSLTVQRGDRSVPNLVASGLFGDGAAAVVAVGDEHGEPSGVVADGVPHPRVVDGRSRLYPDTQQAMGWHVGASGLSIVLGAEVPDLVRRHVSGDVDAFLAGHGLTRADIAWWVCHPGGPKVVEALRDTLDLPPEALALTWDSLERIGNLSSASVLHILADTLTLRPPPPDSYGIAMAMGPGFALELVLLQA